MFNRDGLKGVSVCPDAASYVRWLDDAEMNARNVMMKTKNPAWDHVWPSMDVETGETWFEAGEAELLAQKADYEEQFDHLDRWFPIRNKWWRERYALSTIDRSQITPTVREPVTDPALGARAAIPTGPSTKGGREPLPSPTPAPEQESGAAPLLMEVGPPPPPATPQQQRLDEFLAKVNAATPRGGRTIHESDFWAVAGYKDSTTFRDWKLDHFVSKRARQSFQGVLLLSPQAFFERLAKTIRPPLSKPNPTPE